MSKFAVGVASLYENELVIEIVDAIDWKTALCMHSMMVKDDLKVEDLMGVDLEAVKSSMYDSEMLVDVVPIDL
jgi:hypothetical protein